MYWLWVLAAFLAFFVKGVCGFANTLVFTTVLNFGTSNVNISPVDLTLTYPANILMTVKERRSLKWNICVPMAIIVVLGSIPGMFILKNADVTFVKILFGIATVLVALEILLRSKSKKNKNGSSKIFGLGIGILSGILCGLYGVGALLGAYISRETDNISEFKANFSFVFVVENTLRVVVYSILGIFALDVLTKGISLIPFMLLGLGAGMLCSRWINEKVAKITVVILLIISGISLILTAV